MCLILYPLDNCLRFPFSLSKRTIHSRGDTIVNVPAILPVLASTLYLLLEVSMNTKRSLLSGPAGWEENSGLRVSVAKGSHPSWERVAANPFFRLENHESRSSLPIWRKSAYVKLICVCICLCLCMSAFKMHTGMYVLHIHPYIYVCV